MLKVAKQTKHMDNKESKEEIGQGNKTNTEDYNPKKKNRKKMKLHFKRGHHVPININQKKRTLRDILLQLQALKIKIKD